MGNLFYWYIVGFVIANIIYLLTYLYRVSTNKEFADVMLDLLIGTIFSLMLSWVFVFYILTKEYRLHIIEKQKIEDAKRQPRYDFEI